MSWNSEFSKVTAFGLDSCDNSSIEMPLFFFGGGAKVNPVILANIAVYCCHLLML
jgi:hypothetical protein